MKTKIKKKVIEQQSEDRFSIERRDFFKLFGGGVLISFIRRNPSELLGMSLLQRRSLPEDYNAFLHIDEEGKVKCYTGKIEMGQGPITSLAQQLADELDVKYEVVKMVMGDTDLCPYDRGTWGSMTTRSFSHYMRAAAAEARAVLMQMGAEALEVKPENVDVREGMVFRKSNPKKKITYGELTKGKRIERFLDEKPDVKDHTQFNYVGRSMNHSDGLLKVTGEAKYTGDIRLPGMLYARILRPPSHGATMVSVDTSGAEEIEGIIVVNENDLIAVLHEYPDKAAEALKKIKAKYTFDEKKVNDQNVFEYLLNSDNSSREVSSSGDLEIGKSQSDTLVESEFHDNYKAHAPIEPHTALAQWAEGKMTVWASTQSPFGAQETIANALGLELNEVRVITPFVGGGFGGKSPSSQAVEAAKLAKICGKPVMNLWTREEEFFYDTFRPAAVVKINSGFTKKGKIIYWDYGVYFAGSRGSDTIYNVANARTVSYDEKRGKPVHPFGTGAWRAPANNTNSFSRESQIDIMASMAGIDPLKFRIENLSDQKMISVLNAVSELYDYTPASGPSGRGIGIACGIDAGTWVALIAKVKVDEKTGEVKVLQVACAQDMGLCVNPEGSTIQMEGCITMGLGYSLSEDLEFEGGNIKSRNFDTYQIPKISWVPDIKTKILHRPDQPPQGGGEPAIICMGAVIANAIYDATGVRLYQQPFTPQRVLKAMKLKA